MSYLKVKRYGRLAPDLICFERGRSDLGTHHVLHVPLKFLYSPQYCVIFGLILGFAGTSRVDFDVGGVGRDGDLADNVGCEICTLEDRFQFNTVFQFVQLWVLLDNRHDLEGQVDIFRDPIGHKLENTVRGYKCNRAVAIKPTQTHTLMKLDIVYLYPPVLLVGVSIFDE